MSEYPKDQSKPWWCGGGCMCAWFCGRPCHIRHEPTETECRGNATGDPCGAKRPEAP